MEADRPAGSYIQQEDGALAPNMNDEAMRERMKNTEEVTSHDDVHE